MGLARHSWFSRTNMTSKLRLKAIPLSHEMLTEGREVSSLHLDRTTDPTIPRGNSWRFSPKISGHKFPFPELVRGKGGRRAIASGHSR